MTEGIPTIAPDVATGSAPSRAALVPADAAAHTRRIPLGVPGRPRPRVPARAGRGAPPRPRLLALLLGLAALAALAPRAGAEARDPRFANLWCVDVVVGTFEAPQGLGVTEEALRDAVEVGLRTRLPRLAVQLTCPDALRILVVLATSSTDVFYGMADLTVLRRAIVVDTGQFSRSEAWRTTFVLHGPVDHAKAHLLRVLDAMLAQLAHEYPTAPDR